MIPDLTCTITILNHLAQRVCRFTSRVLAPGDEIVAGSRFTCEIAELPLTAGQYHVNVSLRSGSEIQHLIDGASTFTVEDGALAGRPLGREQRSVVVAPRHRWRIPGAAAG